MTPKSIKDHGVPRQIPGRGPNGRRFCRWCHAEVPKGRSSYCNDECRKHCDFGHSKMIVIRRDGLVCTSCKAALRARWTWPRDYSLPKVEVDHIVAVKDGGSHHPDNLRSLCPTCHRKRTAEQAAERARKRRPKAVQLELGK